MRVAEVLCRLLVASAAHASLRAGDNPFDKAHNDQSEHDDERVFGDGNDNMAEEVADVDGGPKFTEMDLDTDGEITRNEAATWCTKNGVNQGDCTAIFDYLDMDPKNDLVTEQEYEAVDAEEVTEDMAPSFSDLDLNGDDFIEWGEWEMACVCGKSYLDSCEDEEFCSDIFEMVDGDKDKKVSKEEFDKAGEECETADDGDCTFLALKKPSKGHARKNGKTIKTSLSSWVRKHFKRTGASLFALYKLRAQHKKGKFQQVKKGKEEGKRLRK